MTATCPFQKGGRRKRSVRSVSRKAKKSVRRSKRVGRKTRRTRRKHRGGRMSLTSNQQAQLKDAYNARGPVARIGI